MMQNLHDMIPCSWNPNSKETFLINFISILSEYDELDKSIQGATLYEQVKQGFLERGLDTESMDETYRLAKCMAIADSILKKIDTKGEISTLQYAKNLLTNIEKRDEIIKSLTKDSPIN